MPSSLHTTPKGRPSTLGGASGSKDGLGVLLRRGLASHVARADLALLDDLVDGARDPVRLVVEGEVLEHERRREEHRRRVRDVLAGNVLGDVSASGLEEGVLAADVGAGDNTGSSDEGSSNLEEGGERQQGYR